MRRFLPVLAAIMAIGMPTPASSLDPQSVNDAALPAKSRGGVSPGVVKAQILLDRARFSPGIIDGRYGDNVRNAIKAFRHANGLKDSDRMDDKTWAALTANVNEPVLREYTITEQDIGGPFVEDIPDKMEEMAALPHLGYRNPQELLAEKFHMSEDLLRALNPSASFGKAGETIVVAAVSEDAPKQRVERIEIDKSEGALRALGKDGAVIAFYPATVGSEERPAPSGTHKVTRVAMDPNYTYSPEYAFKGVKAKEPFVINPGPNNPVGSVWITLSVEGYGIHGTPDPAKVGKTSSHGCVRLTNWDAQELARMARPGTPVIFKN